ncbi:MAG TPA: hypothetical protein DEA08_08180 [Planctomycetes bacterium]|nr:hypothetical protein [Planctomycetota bacterium]
MSLDASSRTQGACPPDFETLLDHPQVTLLDPDLWAYVIDDLLTPEECQQWIELAEAKGFGPAPITTGLGPIMAPHVRNNTRVMIDSHRAARGLWGRLSPFVPTDFAGWQACGLNERLRFYRYEAGQQFNWHFDGCYARSEREQSHLTVLFYLSSAEGGATEFSTYTDLPAVEPAPGRVLIFKHRAVEHRGAPVFGGRKYVLRSDVMFQAPPLGLMSGRE